MFTVDYNTDSMCNKITARGVKCFFWLTSGKTAACMFALREGQKNNKQATVLPNISEKKLDFNFGVGYSG